MHAINKVIIISWPNGGRKTENVGQKMRHRQTKAELSVEPLSNPSLSATLVKTIMNTHNHEILITTILYIGGCSVLYVISTNDIA